MCRLHCRLVARWWAEASPAWLDATIEGGRQQPADRTAWMENAVTSLALMLGRPGLCRRLQVFRLRVFDPDLSRSQYTSLLMLLARVAPQLSLLGTHWLGAMDAATLAAPMQALARLSQLRHLYIEPEFQDVTFLSRLPRLRTLHLGDKLYRRSHYIFLPPHPLPALRKLITYEPIHADWWQLPKLSYLHAYPASTMSLEPFAASIKTLLLWGAPPSSVVPAALPHLEALACTADMLHHLPSMPALTALDMCCVELPMATPAIDKLACMPALAALDLEVRPFDGNPQSRTAPLFSIVDLANVAALQRLLPRCSISFADSAINKVYLDEATDNPPQMSELPSCLFPCLHGPGCRQPGPHLLSE